jgi:hypothetical protein
LNASAAPRAALPQLFLRGLFAAGAAGAAGAAPAAGWSPITLLSGQTLKAGHCRQLATMAIGHRVMYVSWASPVRAVDHIG